MKKIAVLVAGGSGTRMKSTVPKQFMSINGVPVKIWLVGPNGEIAFNPAANLTSAEIAEYNRLNSFQPKLSMDTMLLYTSNSIKLLPRSGI